MSTENSPNPFDSMRAELAQSDSAVHADPGYLEYWEMRAENDPKNDERIRNIVRGLTDIALRGKEKQGFVEYTNKEPALQARYWYRALGPLNPLNDVEPDMIQAAQLMYGKEGGSQEYANLRLDSAYILTDLARVTASDTTRLKALQLALATVERITERPDYEQQPAGYRLQTEILRGDIFHDALRMRMTGTIKPSKLEDEAYKNYEQMFIRQELKAMQAFDQFVTEGITEENFGILFEWYFIMARRHEAWADREIDTTIVRGATSRENAEWTGEDIPDPKRVTANHDVVIVQNKGGNERTTRLQLKAVNNGGRKYHGIIDVIDFHDVLRSEFTSIDMATRRLIGSLSMMMEDYTKAR